jgi:hypothetical protein
MVCFKEEAIPRVPRGKKNRVYRQFQAREVAPLRAEIARLNRVIAHLRWERRMALCGRIGRSFTHRPVTAVLDEAAMNLATWTPRDRPATLSRNRREPLSNFP